MYESDEMLKIHFDSFDDYIKEGLWDCDCDSVIVRPLVKVDKEEWHERMLVRRPFIFPYRKFSLD